MKKETTMKIAELRYNPAKQKTHGWYKDAQKGDPDATAKWKQDESGKWGASDEYHVYQDDAPEVDKDGNPVLSKSFSEPHFRPRTNDSYDHVTKKKSPRYGQLTSGGKRGEGHILGTVGDWLTKMGAGRDDIARARAEVLHSPEYQELIEMGFEDISTKGDFNNGTITLEGRMEGVIGTKDEKKAFRRKVLANGQIRAYSSYGESVHTHHGWRPATFHPLTIENSPELSPHERIVGTMRQSLRQMVKHYSRAALQHFKHSLKSDSGER
jgi:hypothetical protein